MSCTEDTARGRSPIKRKRNNVSPVWYYIDKSWGKFDFDRYQISK